LSQVPAHKSLLGAAPDTGLPIGSVASQHFANFYLNGLDHFVKHELRVKSYLRYMDDLLLLGPDQASLTGWRDRIADYLRSLRLKLHSDKEKLQRADKGLEYLGYRVYRHHLHLCTRTVNTLKARLDFFKHLLRPDEYPKRQIPVRGLWHDFAQAGFQAPVEPDLLLLKSMEATINSYFGLMGHADHFRLRRDIFHSHFGPLKKFFAPGGPDYLSVRVKKRFLQEGRGRSRHP
jgi:hypothetical protein